MKEKFCRAPFQQMLLKPDGRVTPCCYHYGLHLGHSQHASLGEIWNSKRFQRLREEFLSGNIKTCRGRMQQLQCHEKQPELGDIQRCVKQDHPPKRLDLRLNGTCNLQCTMCEVWQAPRGLYDRPEFWRELEADFLPYVREMDILGGEPLIQKDTFHLIQRTYARNPECRFSFVTNGNVGMASLWKRFLHPLSIGYIQVSMDAVNALTYEQVRRQGNFSALMRTIEQLLAFQQLRQEQGRPFEIRLSFCAVQQNWHELPDFLEYCEKINCTPEVQFAHYDPSGYSSLNFLNQEQKSEVLDALKASIPVRHAARWDIIRRSLSQGDPQPS